MPLPARQPVPHGHEGGKKPGRGTAFTLQPTSPFIHPSNELGSRGLVCIPSRLVPGRLKVTIQHTHNRPLFRMYGARGDRGYDDEGGTRVSEAPDGLPSRAYKVPASRHDATGLSVKGTFPLPFPSSPPHTNQNGPHDGRSAQTQKIPCMYEYVHTVWMKTTLTR